MERAAQILIGETQTFRHDLHGQQSPKARVSNHGKYHNNQYLNIFKKYDLILYYFNA